MRIRISKNGAKFDLGTGFELLSSIGATFLPLFIVIDALSGDLTWVLPSLFLACVVGAVLGGVLTSRPFSAAAAFANGLFVGAVFLSMIFAIIYARVAGPKTTILRVTGLSLGAGILLLLVSTSIDPLRSRSR
jgi:hypothetical protein